MSLGNPHAPLFFRRRVEVVSRDLGNGRGETRGAIEDDYHHFRVGLTYADGRVTTTVAQAPRHPWTLCPQAGGQLDALIGMPLSSVSHAVVKQTDMRHQCTHMFELAGVCIAAAARGLAHRVYDVEVPVTTGRWTATLKRDGVLAMTWDVENMTIAAPPPFSGLSLRQGFAPWVLEHLSEDDAEAALVMRRAVLIGPTRGVRDLDQVQTPHLRGACYAQQPERIDNAKRMVGTTLDFSETPDAPCADDRDWLAFTAAKV